MAEPFARRTAWIEYDYRSRVAEFEAVFGVAPSGTERWAMLIAATKDYDVLAAACERPAKLERV